MKNYWEYWTMCEMYGHRFLNENGDLGSESGERLTCSDCGEVLEPENEIRRLRLQESIDQFSLTKAEQNRCQFRKTKIVIVCNRPDHAAFNDLVVAARVALKSGRWEKAGRCEVCHSREVEWAMFPHPDGEYPCNRLAHQPDCVVALLCAAVAKAIKSKE